VLAAVIALYAGALAILASLGLYAFVWKTVIVPSLLVAAVLTRRLTRFVDDWIVFLSLVVLFDFCRGFVFTLVVHFDLPVYMGYAIAWEKLSCAGHILPVVLQSAWAPVAGILDRFLVVIHGSHFLFFLLFGLTVWLLRQQEFPQYVTAMVLMMYSGLLGYLLIPTVPPWMAAEMFDAIPPLRRSIETTYNFAVPTLQGVFDVNPIAAMPSLHAAFPTLCTLIGLRTFGVKAVAMVVYTLLVFTAIAYLGEHYFVDILAGVLLALAAFAVVYRGGFSLPRSFLGNKQLRPVLLALLVLTVATGLGQLTMRYGGPWVVSARFVQQELLGRNPTAHYYLGAIAYRNGDFASAQPELEIALKQPMPPERESKAARLLVESAFRNGDYQGVIRTVESRPSVQTDLHSLMLLALAYVQTDRYAEGETLLVKLSRQRRDPEPLYWLTRIRYERGEISRDEVLATANHLQESSEPSQAERYQRALLALVNSPS
jgi:hypothetical protein